MQNVCLSLEGGKAQKRQGEKEMNLGREDAERKSYMKY